MLYTPLPDDGSVPIHATAQVTIGPGEKAEVSVTPDTAGSTHFVPAIAVSKLSGATYTVAVDGVDRFGPDSPVPPTDPDDMTATFLRALEMTRSVEITVKDVRGSGNPRDYEIHVLGWEA